MLKVTKEDGRYLVSLFQVNRLNTLFTDLIKSRLSELVDEPGRTVIFNLYGVNFIDSDGFRTLEEITRKAEERKAEFKLSNVGSELEELMEVAGVKDQLRIGEPVRRRERIIMELDD